VRHQRGALSREAWDKASSAEDLDAFLRRLHDAGAEEANDGGADGRRRVSCGRVRFEIELPTLFCAHRHARCAGRRTAPAS
jgi:hypothetical protein